MKEPQKVNFRLLQADTDAVYLLGYAKTQIKRLLATGLLNFAQTWMIGDASVMVRATSFGGRTEARIRLVSDGGEIRYWYSGASAIPCKGRTLSIVRPFEPGYVQRLLGRDQLFSALTRVLLSDGTMLASTTSSMTYDAGFAPVILRNYPRILKWSGGDIQLHDVVQDTLAYGMNLNPTTILAFAVPPDVVYPPLSDTEAIFPDWSDRVGAGDQGPSYASLYISKTYSPSFFSGQAVFQTSFVGMDFSGTPTNTGTGTIKYGVLGDVVGTHAPLSTMDFYHLDTVGGQVKDSTIGFISGGGSGTPTGDGTGDGLDEVFEPHTYPFVSFSTSAQREYFTVIPEPVAKVKNNASRIYALIGTPLLQAAAVQAAYNNNDVLAVGLTANWRNARAGARLRERARRKLCSDNVVAQLFTGTMPLSIQAQLRPNHPVSSKVSMGQLPVVSLTVSESATSSAQVFTYILTKTVQFDYVTYSPSGTPIHHPATISGSATAVTTYHSDAIGLSSISVVVTYRNYPQIDDPSNGTSRFGGLPPEATRPYMPGGGKFAGPSLADGPQDFRSSIQLYSNLPLAVIIDGSVTTGAVDIAETFNGLGLPLVPPYPMSSSNLVYSHPQFYRDYRADVKRIVADLGNTNWLDSTFVDGELLDIFPLSTIHSTFGDLGLFPFSKDVQNTSVLTMLCSAKMTYKYTYVTGTWALVSAVRFDGGTDADGSKRPTPVSFPYRASAGYVSLQMFGDAGAGYPGSPNLVFRSRVKKKDQWPDVATVYKTQQGDITQNPTQGQNPVYSALMAL